MNILIFLIAVSLSMDTFSLSLAYGTLNINKKDKITLSIIVSIYHFVMPLLGNGFGDIIIKNFPTHFKILSFLILIFVGTEMIIEAFKSRDDCKIMKIFELLLFGLAVSIDSFSFGISMKAFTKQYLYSSLTFAITSLIFTYAGVSIGNRINKSLGKISPILGGIVLIFIGILNLI